MLVVWVVRLVLGDLWWVVCRVNAWGLLGLFVWLCWFSFALLMCLVDC